MADKRILPSVGRLPPREISQAYALKGEDVVNGVRDHYTSEALQTAIDASSPNMWRMWDNEASQASRRIAHGVATDDDYRNLKLANREMDDILRKARDFMAIKEVMKPGTQGEFWDSRWQREFRSRYPDIPVDGLSENDIKAGKGIGNAPPVPPPPPESFMSRLLTQPPRPQAPKARTK